MTYSLKKTCDLCYQRKRRCDGAARRRCSYCIAQDHPLCHYRLRRRRAAHALPPPPVCGRSFSSVGEETAPAFFAGGDGRSAPAGSGSGDKLLLPPLKRGRFSASPATGLVGLQENEFLGDFFGCLGFLSLTSEGIVRGAMVGVMLASASPQHQSHRGGCSPSPFSPEHVGEDIGGVRQAVSESSNIVGDTDTGWSNVLAAKNGSGELARDPSTCVLWCAIALGALVKGTPPGQVERYVELAQDSLMACSDGATLGMARAYVAMAVLHNFLGDQVQNHEHFKLANRIVDVLPPEEIPRGLREVLQYTGLTWVLETELASVEEANEFWENVPPFWELSESVVERDVCGFILAVNVRINQPFFDETGVGHVFAAKQQQQQELSEVAPVVTVPPVDNLDLEDAEEVDRVCLDNAEACGDVHKKAVLPEMLRLEKCFEISSTRLGLGGLLYYGELAYLQLLNNEASMVEVSLQRCVEVIVRYPGLCRFNIWFHYVHTLLSSFVMYQNRREYEDLRASYNSVRPVVSPPAPPFEEFRDITDICDAACCRRVATRVQSVYGDF